MNRKIFQQCLNPILLQLWLLLIATPGTAVHQLENVNSPWMLKEDIAMSLSSFLPTAALSKDQAALISQKCVEDSRLVVRALSNRTEWALSSIHFYALNQFTYSKTIYVNRVIKSIFQCFRHQENCRLMYRPIS